MLKLDVNKFIIEQRNSIVEHNEQFKKLRTANKRKHINISKSLLSKEDKFYKQRESLQSDFNLIRKK